LLAACSSPQGNPFAAVVRLVEPPASCQVVFSSNLYAATPDALPEIFCVGANGAPERLTFCNVSPSACAMLEMAPAPDGRRAIVRRVLADTNGDGHLDAADGVTLTYLDLTRGALADLVGADLQVSGLDWSPSRELLVYSALGAGEREDLFRRELGAAIESANLTTSAATGEARPRFDRTGDMALYARDDGDGKSTIWAFFAPSRQIQLSRGGSGGEHLAGSPYSVGADTDPVASPDNTEILFRRLTAVGSDGRGYWDLLVVDIAGGDPQEVAAGPVNRGAPDWGSQGIVFPETNPSAGTTALVRVDESGRRSVLLTVPAGYTLAHPRWLGASR
jgi:hypothetical protein